MRGSIDFSEGNGPQECPRCKSRRSDADLAVHDKLGASMTTIGQLTEQLDEAQRDLARSEAEVAVLQQSLKAAENASTAALKQCEQLQQEHNVLLSEVQKLRRLLLARDEARDVAVDLDLQEPGMESRADWPAGPHTDIDAALRELRDSQARAALERRASAAEIRANHAEAELNRVRSRAIRDVHDLRVENSELFEQLLVMRRGSSAVGTSNHLTPETSQFADEAQQRRWSSASSQAQNWLADLQNKGVRADHMTQSTLVMAAVRSGALQDALDRLQDLHAQKVKVSPVAYEQLILALNKAARSTSPFGASSPPHARIRSSSTGGESPVLLVEDGLDRASHHTVDQMEQVFEWMQGAGYRPTRTMCEQLLRQNVLDDDQRMTRTWLERAAAAGIEAGALVNGLLQDASIPSSRKIWLQALPLPTVVAGPPTSASGRRSIVPSPSTSPVASTQASRRGTLADLSAFRRNSSSLLQMPTPGTGTSTTSSNLSSRSPLHRMVARRDSQIRPMQTLHDESSDDEGDKSEQRAIAGSPSSIEASAARRRSPATIVEPVKQADTSSRPPQAGQTSMSSGKGAATLALSSSPRNGVKSASSPSLSPVKHKLGLTIGAFAAANAGATRQRSASVAAILQKSSSTADGPESQRPRSRQASLSTAAELSGRQDNAPILLDSRQWAAAGSRSTGRSSPSSSGTSENGSVSPLRRGSLQRSDAPNTLLRVDKPADLRPAMLRRRRSLSPGSLSGPRLDPLVEHPTAEQADPIRPRLVMSKSLVSDNEPRAAVPSTTTNRPRATTLQATINNSDDIASLRKGSAPQLTSYGNTATPMNLDELRKQVRAKRAFLRRSSSISQTNV